MDSPFLSEWQLRASPSVYDSSTEVRKGEGGGRERESMQV